MLYSVILQKILVGTTTSWDPKTSTKSYKVSYKDIAQLYRVSPLEMLDEKRQKFIIDEVLVNSNDEPLIKVGNTFISVIDGIGFSKLLEFEDDESALLWYRLNYGA